MFDPFRPFILTAQLAAAQKRIAELEHTVDVLEVCIANYQDAWTARSTT